MFRGSEDIVRRNSHEHFEPSMWPWPWTQQSHLFHMTLRLMMLYYQTKFGCKRTSSLEATEIVTFWLYKLSLWPWHWTQWTNFSAWHSGLWHCITISGLATKCFVVLLTQWYCSVFTYSYVTFVNLGLPLSLTCVWGKRAKSNQYWLISNTQKVQKKTFLIRQYKTMCIFSVNHLFQFMNE